MRLGLCMLTDTLAGAAHCTAALNGAIVSGQSVCHGQPLRRELRNAETKPQQQPISIQRAGA